MRDAFIAGIRRVLPTSISLLSGFSVHPVRAHMYMDAKPNESLTEDDSASAYSQCQEKAGNSGGRCDRSSVTVRKSTLQ